MISYQSDSNHILYYEIMDIPLQELENLREFKITFVQHGENGMEAKAHNIRISKDSTVMDIFQKLKETYPTDKPLILMQVKDFKISNIVDPKEVVGKLSYFFDLLAMVFILT
jgi:hypothetical protein